MPQPLVTPGEVRRPRARALLDGKPVAGMIEVNVTSNNYYQADTFDADFALHAPGAAPLRWWSERAKMLLSVEFGYEQRGVVSEWVDVITGEVDKVDVQPAQGGVRISGRDLTARLIDAQTQEAFQNRTSSEIATLLAGRHGLTPVVTATSQMASRYYREDHDKVSHNQFSRVGTEWDLLVDLAQKEGFDVFVRGTSLRFQPATKPDADPFTVQWRLRNGRQEGDIMGLSLTRSLTLAKDVVVEVRSWRSREGRGFTRRSPPGGIAKGAQRYSFTKPNLTETQAQQEADRLRAEITKHERDISFTCPGELRLTPRHMLQLTGTDSEWDQAYYVASIARRLSFDGGFVMQVQARNQSPTVSGGRG